MAPLQQSPEADLVWFLLNHPLIRKQPSRACVSLVVWAHSNQAGSQQCSVLAAFAACRSVIVTNDPPCNKRWAVIRKIAWMKRSASGETA